MQSSSRSPPSELDLGMLSTYEDAVDESETELQRLCEDAARHLRKERPRPQSIVLAPLIRSGSSKHKRSSSSEHSSIEKLAEGPSSAVFRARRAGNGRSGRRGQRSGSDQSDDDWRMVNYAFQEVAHYPVLVQINQQMQQLSRQLYEIESTNALQLKIIARLLGKLIKARHRSFFSFGRFFRFLPIFLCAICWPFVARYIYIWVMKRRQALSFLRYL